MIPSKAVWRVKIRQGGPNKFATKKDLVYLLDWLSVAQRCRRKGWHYKRQGPLEI
jgi:hypothetical protein